MANNPLEIITSNKKKIKEIQSDIELLYEELGRCVSDMAKFKSINYCDALITDYSLANEEYIQLKKTQEKFTNIEKNSKSLEKELKIINKNLKDNEKRLKDIFMRIGAAAYEAYCSNTLIPEIMRLLYPLFDSKQKKVSYFEKQLKGSKNSMMESYYQVRLKNIRLSFIDIFYQTAVILEKNEYIDLIPYKKRALILTQYSKCKHTESELIYSSKIYESELKGLKKDGSLSVKSKLEELKITVSNAHVSAKAAATLLGTELYEIIPGDINSNEIGESAIALIDQITLHKSVVENLKGDIDLLKNEISIAKIKSQIANENSNIDRLEIQIKSCREKISTIEDTISDKKNQIDILVDEGVYIEED